MGNLQDLHIIIDKMISNTDTLVERVKQLERRVYELEADIDYLVNKSKGS